MYAYILLNQDDRALRSVTQLWAEIKSFVDGDYQSINNAFHSQDTITHMRMSKLASIKSSNQILNEIKEEENSNEEECSSSSDSSS